MFEGGYQVVAFCDSNTLKQGGTVCGMPILSIESAIKEYGNDLWYYISPAAPINSEIEDFLIHNQITDKKHIINKTEKRIYRSCSSLENVAVVTNQGIFYCCSLENIRNASPWVAWKSSIEETVDEFIVQRDKFIDELQNNEADNPCAGCPALCESAWDVERKVTVLALSLSYPCQLSCEYCELKSNAKYIKDNKNEVATANAIDIGRLVKVFEDKGKFKPSEPIQLSGGEITISSKKKELLSAVSKYPLQIFTNGIIYDEDIVKAALENNESYLNVSLDAGTRNTYKKVKGLDVFDKVTEALKKYSTDGLEISLKYIILPENCNKEDYDGFLTIAEDIKPKEIVISCDIYVETSTHSRDVIDGAIYLGIGAKKLGIKCTVMPYFGVENLEYIERELERTLN